MIIELNSSEVVLDSGRASEQQRGSTLMSEKTVVNKLEDLALTQTMFQEGTLIHQGHVDEFVDIIRTNRHSLHNLDLESEEVQELFKTCHTLED